MRISRCGLFLKLFFLVIFLNHCGPPSITINERGLKKDYSNRLFLDFDIKHKTLERFGKVADLTKSAETYKTTNSYGETFTQFEWSDLENDIEFEVRLDPYDMKFIIENKSNRFIRLKLKNFIFYGPYGKNTLIESFSMRAARKNLEKDAKRRGEKLESFKSKPVKFGEMLPMKTQYSPVEELDLEKNSKTEFSIEYPSLLKQYELDKDFAKGLYWGERYLDKVSLWRNYYDRILHTDMAKEMKAAKRLHKNQVYYLNIGAEIDGIINDYKLSFEVRNVTLKRKIGLSDLPILGKKYEYNENFKTKFGVEKMKRYELGEQKSKTKVN